MKDTRIEIKNNLQGNKSRVDEAENQINELEHRKQKTTNQNNKKKEPPQNKDRVSILWDNFKCTNTHIIGVPEEKKKNKKLEIYLKK